MQYNVDAIDEWEKEFRPINNHFGDRGWGGKIFETYNPDLAYVLEQNPKTVWTWWDTEAGSEIVAGYHLVNRIGYFITEKEWTEPLHSIDVEIREEDDELIDL